MTPKRPTISPGLPAFRERRSISCNSLRGSMSRPGNRKRHRAAQRVARDTPARLYVSAREPQVAIDFLARMYEQTSDENVKSVLERRLKEVVVERDLQLLEGAISRYRERHRRPPERLEDLVGPGLLRVLPREPFGGRYLYDPQPQTVRTREMKERLKVYEKRRRR